MSKDSSVVASVTLTQQFRQRVSSIVLDRVQSTGHIVCYMVLSSHVRVAWCLPTDTHSAHCALLPGLVTSACFKTNVL